MRVFLDLIQLSYLVVVLALAVYGLHNLLTTLLYLRSRGPRGAGRPSPLQADLPPVTIQLPVFNEKYTVERLLRAVVRLDYPADRLQVQVLDDSTDDTYELVRTLVDAYAAQGLNVVCIHRTDRSGYKAGALANGMRTATGELIGIFDADFVPPPDWLTRTVPMFQNESLGCLQTRWGHTNRRYNSLTRAQAMGIDGHFLVEQTARSRNHFFLNFNGTAGLWRRKCIEQAGGWQWDTLTEDLDLSYRMQILGYRILYLRDLLCPGEIPPTVPNIKQQQSRWANGAMRVARKILPGVLRNRQLGFGLRLQALIHLTGYMIQPLMVFSFALSCLAAIGGINAFNAAQLSALIPAHGIIFAARSASLIILQNLAWFILAPLIVLTVLALLPYVLPKAAPAELGSWFPKSNRIAQIILAAIAMAIIILTILGSLPG